MSPNVLPLCLVAYFRHLTFQKYTKYWFSDKNSDKNWTSHETKRLLEVAKIGFLNVNVIFKLNYAFCFSTFCFSIFSFQSLAFQFFISLNFKRKSSEARSFKSFFLCNTFQDLVFRFSLEKFKFNNSTQHISWFSFQIQFGRIF